LESKEWKGHIPFLGFGSWVLIFFGNACEAIETMGWASFLGGGGGGNCTEIVGNPSTQGEGGCTISFHPSLTEILGGKDTCGSTSMIELLVWGCKGGCPCGGGVWKALCPTKFKKPSCKSWLNSFESTSKWIENQILLFPLCQKYFGLIPLPWLPLLKNIIYKV